MHAGLRGGFQSTPSVWRETQLSTSYQPQFNISIHSLRVEGDQLVSFLFPRPQNFNPLPPCGGRPLRSPICKGACRISIHSLRVEGDRQRCFAGSSVPGFQSTPSVWRETTHGSGCQRPCAISIHSLRVEGDLKSLSVCRIAAHFNPLPPCGGRRINIICIRHAEHNFNPLPPCGGRRGLSTTTASP